MGQITHEQKELALEAIRAFGTMSYGAKAAGVSVRSLNREMLRSEVFKRRVLEARAEGYSVIADGAIDLIRDYADGKYPQKETDRNRLTAAIALANAFMPGFRGTTTIQGRVEHNVRVITAVPRPKYVEEPRVKVIEEKPLQDKPKSVEEAVEGVAVET